MQPFDALSMRAVIQEARSLLLNRKVDKVQQLGRDEVVLALRGKAGMLNLFLSAQSAHGRLCLVASSSTDSRNAAFERYTGRAGHNQPAFSVLLRKHLTGATLIGVDQQAGERITDLIFSCVDEVGSVSVKILTAEIMGRHSNLIFWDKNSEKILAASHAVTKDMSRQREVMVGLRYERPPGQDRPNVFKITDEEFDSLFAKLVESFKTDTKPADRADAAVELPGTVEQWLLTTFTGLGRHLCEEIVAVAELPSQISEALALPQTQDQLRDKLRSLRQASGFQPAMRTDLSRYSILGWLPDKEGNTDWKQLPSVNDMIEEYFRSCEAKEQFTQLRERLRTDLRQESDKIESRITQASQHIENTEDLARLKQCGDLILSNIASIQPGQEEFACDNLFDESGASIKIKLNPNLSTSQNAQTYYRQYAKSRSRQGAATVARKEASARLEFLKEQLGKVEEAQDIHELRGLKDLLFGRKTQDAARPPQQQSQGQANQNKKKTAKQKILSLNSSDGWTIYVGRNRMENEQLLNKLAQPQDIWLHILGQSGAHVLIKVPSTKQEPPLTTIKEAAQVAARLSKTAIGAKVRVVYTQCKYVRKASKDKTGVVRYENEKTLEVDTGQPMPRLMRQLFGGQDSDRGGGREDRGPRDDRGWRGGGGGERGRGDDRGGGGRSGGGERGRDDRGARGSDRGGHREHGGRPDNRGGRGQEGGQGNDRGGGQQR